MNKYELVEDNVKDGCIQIRALKDFGDVKQGDLGGYVKDYHNLSQEGECWLYDSATVSDNAVVRDNAKVYDSKIFDNAVIEGDAVVTNQSKIYGSAVVCDNAQIYRSTIYDESEIYGTANVIRSKVFNKAKIYGNASVDGSSVFNTAQICDNTYVFESSLYGNVICKGQSIIVNSNLLKSTYIDSTVESNGEVNTLSVWQYTTTNPNMWFASDGNFADEGVEYRLQLEAAMKEDIQSNNLNSIFAKFNLVMSVQSEEDISIYDIKQMIAHSKHDKTYLILFNAETKRVKFLCEYL